MSATAIQLNWVAVEFASTPLTHVTSVMFGQGGSLIPFSGDNNRYPILLVNNVSNPRASVTSADVATIMGINPGTSGTLTATQDDATGATGGAIVWTLANAVHENSDDTGQWGQYASASASFLAFSSDGITNPLSFTRS